MGELVRRTPNMPGDAAPRRTVGVALYGDLTHDSRVRREAATLARAGFVVRVVCLDSTGLESDLTDGVTILTRRPTGTAALPGTANPFWQRPSRWRRAPWAGAAWLVRYASGLRSWGRTAVAAVGSVDAWHVHDLPALAAIAPHVARRVPIVYDSHELFLEAGTAARLPGPLRRLLGAWERRLVSRVAAIVTVNDALGSVLRDRYPARPVVVVHNCPDRWTAPAGPADRLRDAAGVAPGTPVILHHGSLGANRGIEQLIEAMTEPGLETAHLVLLGPGEVRSRYEDLAKASRCRDRVHVLDPVPPVELPDWVATATVGAMPIQRSTRNHYLATPNKLFECLATGVPVVASDFPAMRRIVMGDPAGALGAVCDPASVTGIAEALRSILALDRVPYEAMRARCLAAAHRRWNWGAESAGLVELFSQVTQAVNGSGTGGRPRPPPGRGG